MWTPLNIGILIDIHIRWTIIVSKILLLRMTLWYFIRIQTICMNSFSHHQLTIKFFWHNLLRWKRYFKLHIKCLFWYLILLKRLSEYVWVISWLSKYVRSRTLMIWPCNMLIWVNIIQNIHTVAITFRRWHFMLRILLLLNSH